MKKQIFTLTLLLIFSVALNLLPVTVKAQTSTANSTVEDQLAKLKKDYAEGKITLEVYQQQSNALLQASAPVTGIHAGTHFEKGGKCLIAGAMFTLLGVGAVGSAPYIPYGDNSATLAQLGVGGGLAFIGIILDIAGGTQLIKGGKKLKAQDSPQACKVELHSSTHGLGFAFKF